MEEGIGPGSKKIFECTETESEEEKVIIIPKISVLKRRKTHTDYMFINNRNYKFGMSWNKFFPNKKVNIYSMLFNPAWNDFFSIVCKKKTKDKSGMVTTKSIIDKLEDDLTEYMLNKNEIMVPPPELVFNIFNIMNLSKIKVIILGQDPYQTDNWAVGMSFSVPIGIAITSSLINVFKNLVKFKHVREKPTTGNLIGWVLQGCFLLNSALTTFKGKSRAHKDIWPDFTREIMKYLNDKLENCVFLAWGADAFNMCENIDRDKHCVIASSHPSGLACNTFSKKNFKGKIIDIPSFNSCDHFGLTNKYLKSVGKTPIIWDLLLDNFL